MQTQRELLIAFAAYQVGYEEGANNWNQFSAFFNKNEQSWCADFIAWCARQSSIDESVIPSSSYVPDFVTFFSKLGLFKKRGSYTPRGGDLIVYDFNGNGSGDHVGIVESVSGGKVTTLEGNTSKQGESGNGDGVWRKTRSLAYTGILGYCCPDYPDEKEEEEVEIIKVPIRDKTRNKIIKEVDGVKINGKNYIELRDVELIAPVKVDWDGTYPTIEVNYKA